jgi:hypothetical protein
VISVELVKRAQDVEALIMVLPILTCCKLYQLGLLDQPTVLKLIELNIGHSDLRLVDWMLWSEGLSLFLFLETLTGGRVGRAFLWGALHG